jgi:hypothetical protein
MVAVSAHSTPSPVLRAFGEWVVKRGVLYALIETPILALFVSMFFRYTTYPIATAFSVLLAFAILPVWILIRKNQSTDPDEPVHHLHRYALYALVPYVVYNLSRMPMHYIFNIVFWDHWYDFGSEFAGQPVDQWSSLIPGTLLHSLQGYVLALGFFVLFQRHSLFNALLYIFVYLSALYSFQFPVYILVDFQPPPKWFFVVWWAHFWMALAAWLMPRLYAGAVWGRLGYATRAVVLPVLVLVYVSPFAFVFWRAGTWQFPLQRAIDQALFDRPNLLTMGAGPTLTAAGGPTPTAAGEEARYKFSLQFGPRTYKDYINATKALDAGPVSVTGHLLRDGGVIAWCSGYVAMLETPNTILYPAEYFPALRRMEYTDIPVECVGPSEAAAQLRSGADVQARWTAKVTLIGDRERVEREYRGGGATVLAVAPGVLIQPMAMRP